MCRRVRADGLFFLLALGLSLFALGPLLQPGYFWGAHDARHHVYFLFEWDRSVQEGILWPRWSPDFCFGYGYPFFNIYGPLATMLGEGFHLLGADYVAAVKWVFALAILAGACTMYGFAQRLWGPKAGFLASLAYTYAPYHILDVYVRAALPETLSLAFLPLVLWGFYEAVARPRWGAVLWAGAAYAGLMLTSNAIALMFSPVLGLYVLALVVRRVLREQPVRAWSRESALPLLGHLLHVGLMPLLGLLAGLGLSAIFWLPAATEFRYVRTDQWYAGRYDYRDDFVYPFQLLGPYWGFGTSVAGPDDEISFQMGTVPVVLGTVALAAGVVRRRRGFGHALFFATVVAASAFLMTWASAPLWEALSPVRFAQFPWRYQTLLAPALSLLAGSLLASPLPASTPTDREPSLAAACFLGLLVLLGSYPYLQAEVVEEPKEGPVSLAALMRFQQGSDEMTGATVWTKEIPRWSPMADLHVAGKPVTTLVDYAAIPPGGVLGVHSLEMSSVHEKVWVYAADEKQEVVFYRFYYPGWHAYLLDEHTEEVLAEAPIHTVGPEGRMAVRVPSGRYLLLLRFEDTPVRRVGKALSAATVSLLLTVGVARALLRRGGAR
ncbi:MAG: glycosyltransferase family 39 protein [Anaerolineae bacterium]